MTAPSFQIEELRALTDAACDAALADRDAARLEDLLRGSIEAQRFYLAYVRLDGCLRWEFGNQAEGISDQPLTASQFSPSPLPSLSTTHYPLPTNFVGGPVFSYMVATVVLAVMLLGAWAYNVNHDRNLTADNSRRSTTSGPVDQPKLVFVGRITGMKDCRWSDPDTQTVVGAAVSLDRKYSLTSGLLEITYKTGAKVILEGPCTYKVASSAGGFLEQGKLTARIVHQGPAASAAGAKPQAEFVVATPTAIVTDLGTEFGVEVDDNGDTVSYVFEGKVVVKTGIRQFGDSGIRGSEKRPATAVAGDAEGDVVQLTAGESVLVTKDKTETLRFTHPTTPPKFVRRLHEPLKEIDLLDAVAGGNGLGRQRGSGIDAASGRLLRFIADTRTTGDGQFRPVLWSRIIDGVFIPDGRSGAVQVDSTGGAFDGFPETLGRTWGPLWARGAGDVLVGIDDDPKNWIHLMDHAEQFTPKRQGMLCLHADAGITFDLEVVRRVMHWPGPMRFQAAAGMVGSTRTKLDFDGTTDLWVIIDGRAAMKRDGLRRQDGAVSIDIELSPADRFLTLAATDGGDGITSDWVVFGDPVLKPLKKNEIDGINQ